MNFRRIAGCSLLSIVALFSQSINGKPTAGSDDQADASKPAAGPAANPADVSSMDAILAALYDVISGPAGQKRNWDRMRSLFVPGARLIPSGKRSNGDVGHRVLDVEGYISGSAPFLEKEGFYEREIARRVDQWGTIAQVFSTYESKHTATDEKPFARGINSIQLLNDGKRWWIVTIFWTGETPDNPLPSKYLTTGGGR